MALDDPLAKRQANAYAGVFSRSVQALEDDEDAVEERGSMPMPLSCAEKSHALVWSPDRLAPICTTGGSGPRNLRAFDSRFWKSWPICVGSAVTVGSGSWVLAGRTAEHPLGAAVPAPQGAVQVLGEDGVIRGVDDGREMRALPLEARGIEAHEAADLRNGMTPARSGIREHGSGAGSRPAQGSGPVSRARAISPSTGREKR